MKNPKVLVLLVVLLIASMVVVGCGGGQKASSGDKAGSGQTETVTFKLGHVGPADAEHPWEKYAQKFAQEVEKQTNGRVKIETYPASQLGADREMTEALQQGTMEMGLISTIAMGNFVPELQLWDLPYIFPMDNAKVDEIIEGPVGDKLAEAAAKKKLHIIAYWENDWRNMSSGKKAILEPTDLKGQKMRVVENKPSLDWFKRVGAIPTPMAFSELYTALQQGTVDGQDNGVVLSYGTRFHEVQKYYTRTKHIYCPLAMVVSEDAWNKLSAEDQQTLKKLAVEIGREQRQYNRQKAEEWLGEMEKAGLKVTRELSPEALKKFQASAEGTYKALAATVGQDMIDKMLEYRK